MSISGYNNQKGMGRKQFATIHNVGSQKYAMMSPQLYLWDFGKDYLGNLGNFTAIDVVVDEDKDLVWITPDLPLNGVEPGDVLRFTNRDLIHQDIEIVEVGGFGGPVAILDIGRIDPNGNGPGLPYVYRPDVGTTFKVLRWTTATSDQNGALNVVAQPRPTVIVKDGLDAQITKDTVNPSNTVAMPVELVAASGSPINITAGDLNVQLNDGGPNPDRVRIWDGSGNSLKVNANGSADVNILGTVPVSGPLTDAELRATPVPISGTVTANTGLSQPLTDAQLRAAAVPVSGPLTDAELRATAITVTGPLTDAQLRASAVPVSPDVSRGTGNVDANTQRVTLAQDGTFAIAVGSIADAAATTDTGSFSIIAFIKRSLQNWTTLLSRVPTLTVASTRLLVDGSGVTQPVAQTALTVSYQEITNLTTSPMTFTAPAGAKWCKIYASDANTANIRVRLAGTATISSGIQFQPGRSEDFNAVGNISVIAESGSGQHINVHFGV